MSLVSSSSTALLTNSHLLISARILLCCGCLDIMDNEAKRCIVCKLYAEFQSPCSWHYIHSAFLSLTLFSTTRMLLQLFACPSLAHMQQLDDSCWRMQNSWPRGTVGSSGAQNRMCRKLTRNKNQQTRPVTRNKTMSLEDSNTKSTSWEMTRGHNRNWKTCNWSIEEALWSVTKTPSSVEKV